MQFIQGGNERQDSVYNALMYVKGGEYVLVHDGARPFVTKKMMKMYSTAAKEKGASICAVPVKDTIKKVIHGVVVETVERYSFKRSKHRKDFCSYFIRSS